MGGSGGDAGLCRMLVLVVGCRGCGWPRRARSGTIGSRSGAHGDFPRGMSSSHGGPELWARGPASRDRDGDPSHDGSGARERRPDGEPERPVPDVATVARSARFDHYHPRLGRELQSMLTPTSVRRPRSRLDVAPTVPADDVHARRRRHPRDIDARRLPRRRPRISCRPTAPRLPRRRSPSPRR